MPKVIRAFYDKQDNYKAYTPNNVFESNDDERINELQEKGFLEQKSKQLPKDEFPKHVGGGYYELPNGDKIRGKDKAHKALKQEG